MEVVSTLKSRFLYLIASLLLLVFSVFLFSWLPGKIYPLPPQPSVPSGYYESAFSLSFQVPSGCSIYYTTDGSLPTDRSALYTGSIPIRDRSQEPNRLNAVQNVTADWRTYTPDPTPVAKGTVIRAICINRLGNVSQPITLTYFVGLQPPESGLTLSLIFPPEDFFGPDGIYVTGQDYDSWYAQPDAQSPQPVPNYRKDLEIPATLQLFDQNDPVLEQAIGVRLQGASTREAPKKRLTLTARSEYSGINHFTMPLFADVSSHSVMLKDNLPDAMMAQIVSDRQVAVQQSVPVRLFLNGEFWQDTYMLERYDQQYFRQHYHVDNRILVKNGFSDEDTARYEAFMDWVAHTNFSQEENYAQLCQEVDVQSYIDYIAINYYMCNWDMSENKNYVLWTSPEPGPSHYQDTRWRWCIFDIDILEYAQYNSYTAYPPEINIFTTNFSETRLPIHDSTLFRTLCANGDFRRSFVTSFLDIVNNNFSAEHLLPVLASHGQDLSWMNGYFLDRPAYAAQHLAQEFGLTGTLETVTITASDASLGSVQVNTSVVDLTDGIWSGQYFTDYPITVTATPAPGAKFVGWQGDVESDQNTITVPMDGGVHLEAVFAPA